MTTEIQKMEIEKMEIEKMELQKIIEETVETYDDRCKELLTELPETLKELMEDFADIPFGNTDYQIEHFVISPQKTPARAYRTIGLEMISLIDSFYSSMDAFLGLEHRLKKLDKKIKKATENNNEHKLLRLSVQKSQIIHNLNYSKKLLFDLEKRFNLYYEKYKAFPKITLEEFNAQEPMFHNLDLIQQINFGGAGRALENIHTDKNRLDELLVETKNKLGIDTSFNLENKNASGSK